jgi:hypothetical protein
MVESRLLRADWKEVLMRHSALCRTWLALVVCACSDSATAPAPVASFAPVVSNVIAGSSAASRGAIAPDLSALDPVAFVSLEPGAIPEGLSGSIRDLQNGASRTVTLVDGGFDPVAIPATAGDTLEIEIALSGGGLAFAKAVVPIRQPPRVVRTSPAKGRTDVAINASVAVIFSEPVEPATLDTASIHLLAGDAAVEGSIRPLDGPSMEVTFVPTTPLQPATAYRLVLNHRITDRSGDHLEGATEFGFATSADDGPPAPADPPVHLSFYWFLTTPVAPGAELWPAVKVLVRDTAGAVVDWKAPITISLRTGPAGATLSGTLTVSATDGLAVFPGLKLSTSGSGFTLQAASPGAAPAISQSFSIPPFDAPCCGVAAASFSMLELGTEGNWWYAPQVTLTETSGRGPIHVMAVMFIVPGVAPETGIGICFDDLQVPAGGSVEVFHEIYGDYQVALDHRLDRVTSATATMRVYSRDGIGRLDSLDVVGPIVPGDMPRTYTGGAVPHPAVACGLT